MEKYFLGVTDHGLQRRVKIERQHAEVLAKVFIELEKQIKNTSESDGWQRLILFSTSNELLKGFVSGLHAGNYDVSTVFIDSLFKLVDTKDTAETEKFLDWLSAFSERENIFFFITISEDVSNASEGMKSGLGPFTMARE